MFRINLFSDYHQAKRQSVQPLAARMRPRTLDEFTGQKHILGEGKLLRRMITADRLSSLIFHGPPGCGKTALARVIAEATRCRFRTLNATQTGTKEVRELLDTARSHVETQGERTVLFLDEIHRFTKAQQDVLLPDVEDGVLILIGATTQNPYFALTNALISRSQIFTLESLTADDLKQLIQRALTDQERGLASLVETAWQIEPDAEELLIRLADGDARRCLNALEIAALSAREAHTSQLTVGILRESIQAKAQTYDRDGDAHYDIASALIKSMRGSDPNAALHWLARMLEGGEEVRFIARRLVIFASEDVGNADPHALPLAVACAQAVEMVGLPECQLNLAQTVIYLACALKSNSATVAIGLARQDVRTGVTLPVPIDLRDSHYAGAKSLGHGGGYQYPHDHPDGIVSQTYLPVDRHYYQPTARGYEKEIQTRLAEWKKLIPPEAQANTNRRKPQHDGG